MTRHSGGARRALAGKPNEPLLDEPFGALDAEVRTELRRWLRRLHQEVTSVFVTHDQEDTLEVSDRMVIMNEGRFHTLGLVKGQRVYVSPTNVRVFAEPA
ncbi:MAG TPA: hypothetical protein VFZ26_00250 [Gemmatimonadales bacterium]